MDNKQYIVALEIASSHVAATAAAFDPQTKDVSELCHFEETVKDCVRYGCISNVEEVLSKLTLIFNRIERHPKISPRKISSVFIGIEARSLHSDTIKIEKDINDEFPISETLINSIFREAEQEFKNVYILKTLPKYFEVDGKEMDLKPGAIGSHIKAEINVITCRTQITKNINLLLGRAGKKLAGFICTPLAASGITLTEEEKRLGCVLVDFGADITTVSIYKNNHLQYLNVIPMGSRNITRDLTTLNLLDDQAELVKKTYGIIDDSEIPESSLYGIRSLDIVNYIKARMEEIFINIHNQIKLANFTEEQLPKGFVFIGKGSKLRGLANAIAKQTKMPFRLGGHIDAPERSEYADNIQLLSMLDAISEDIDSNYTSLFTPEFAINNDDNENEEVAVEEKNPAREVKEIKKPRKQKFGLFGKVKNFLGELSDAAAGKDMDDDDENDDNDNITNRRF